MKRLILLLFTTLLQNLTAQTVDSVAIKQVDRLIKISQELLEKRDFEKALKVNASAEKIVIEKLGKDSEFYGSICYIFGNYYELNGDYTNAEKWYLNALTIQSRKDQSLEYAKTLNSIANIYADQGKAEKAEANYKVVLDIREKKLGKEHPDYASILNNLAGIYQFTGEYDLAISMFEEAKKIFGQVYGVKSKEYAQALHNLANVYFETGNFNQAELFYTEALNILEKENGRNDPQSAATINCLGNLYSVMGLKDKALSLYQEALAVLTTNLGGNDINVTACLNNIAEIFSEKGQFEQAENYYLKSKQILENTFGKESPDYAMTIDNMANMYVNKHDFNQAEKYYLEAFKIRKKNFGSVHPEVAISLNNLGSFYTNQNQPKLASHYLNEAKDVWEHLFGKVHPDYVLAINNLICNYWITNQNELLMSSLIESNQIEKTLVSRASKHLSESELSDYIHTFTSSLDRLFTYTNESGTLSGLSYNNILFYKGYLLNFATQLNRLAKLDTSLTRKINDLKVCNEKLAKELSIPQDQRSKDKIILLEEMVTESEKEITRKVHSFNELQQEINYKDIVGLLKPGEAVIEFINFNLIKAEATDSILYAAFLLKNGSTEPHYIKLFEQKSLDSLLQLGSVRRSEYVNNLYNISDRGTTLLTTHKKSLYDVIWKPIEKELEGIKTIYFSPSGLLHNINLDAIPISEIETLADKYNLINLNSTRQIVIPAQLQLINNNAILYGGIQFDQDSTNQNKKELVVPQPSGEIFFNNNNSNSKGGSWNYLPGTEREVSAIEKIIQASGFDVISKKAYAATEETFKNIGNNNSPSPRILHIATHGYFFPDPKMKQKYTGILDQNEPVFKLSNHPMLRSGLILAGGNSAWQGNQPPEDREDGILTAYEISQMNLSNTELVVLSACETGLGDIQGNEGVYGLQRAFKIAGAKYLIMSLWQVPDKQTSLLMTTFYKKWLEDKMTIPDAFHAAQKELREIGLDPYQWAGFVLVE